MDPAASAAAVRRRADTVAAGGCGAPAGVALAAVRRGPRHYACGDRPRLARMGRLLEDRATLVDPADALLIARSFPGMTLRVPPARWRMPEPIRRSKVEPCRMRCVRRSPPAAAIAAGMSTMPAESCR